MQGTEPREVRHRSLTLTGAVMMGILKGADEQPEGEVHREVWKEFPGEELLAL